MQKRLKVRQQWKKEMRKLRGIVTQQGISLCMQPSFPDSGHYYRSKERLYDKNLRMLEKIMGAKRYKRYFDYQVRSQAKLVNEYYAPIPGYGGQSAADLDNAMAWH